MKYYRCRCGKLEQYGSMGPSRCRWCEDCKTGLSDSPDTHPTERVSHHWVRAEVSTDEGLKPLTTCSWCGVKQTMEIVLAESQREMRPTIDRMKGGEPPPHGFIMRSDKNTPTKEG